MSIDNIQEKNSKGYRAETLLRRLCKPSIDYGDFGSMFFFSLNLFSSLGFLYQNSKASWWIHWNSKLNRDLVPAVAGQNHNHLQTGKEMQTHPMGAFELRAQCHWALEAQLSLKSLLCLHADCSFHQMWACADATLPWDAPVSNTAVKLC